MARPIDLDITAIVQAEVKRITDAAYAAIEDGVTDDLAKALRAKGWTLIPPEPTQPPENTADLAALTVLQRHGLEVVPGERPLSALGWAMGDGIPYEQALREYGEALVLILGGGKP
ncbi:hypothetical protein SEA_FIREMAN_12 [Microbacterium phage Fireman]|uniref:Uncharacterized protein n=1 Tax=Microbacterium phage Fireman TaxID=2530118 RepID=A0A481VVY4_9CAUD|nr:hypothetical protein HOV22_gp13 [Microbacterium phage Fireman]QBI98096.1 hypothetical protein SEA_FIREMAN_12 [Microbacterium phage Fireman]